MNSGGISRMILRRDEKTYLRDSIKLAVSSTLFFNTMEPCRPCRKNPALRTMIRPLKPSTIIEL